MNEESTNNQIEAVEVDPQSQTTVPLDEKGLPRLGIHEGVKDDDYRRATGMNKSGLDLIDISAHTYIFEKSNPRPTTPALFFGKALHTLILQPEKFTAEYAPMPTNAPSRPSSRQINAAKPSPATLDAIAWWNDFEKQNEGKVLISTSSDPDKGVWGMSDWDRIQGMAHAVMANPIASAFLDGARREVSMWWVDNEINKLCKGRTDILSESHNILCDVKTTDAATWTEFQRSVIKYRYDVQAAFYSDGVRANGQLVSDFIFIVVEKDPPFLTACYFLPHEWEQVGRIKYRANLQTYKKCIETGEWPGLPPLRQFDMPTYARYGRIS